MGDFDEINKKLEELNHGIITFSENLKFKNQQEFDLSEELDLEKVFQIPHSKGIYLFEIKKEPSTLSFDKWMSEIQKKWETEPIRNSPKVTQKYKEKHTNSLDGWIPFYLGKSEKIMKRIKEHLSLDSDSSTYALKLKARSKFHKETFRLSFIEIETEYYDLVMHKIEYELRKQYNPIIGKQ